MLAISTLLSTLAYPLPTPIGPVVLFPASSSSTFRLCVIAYTCVFSCVCCLPTTMPLKTTVSHYEAWAVKPLLCVSMLSSKRA